MGELLFWVGEDKMTFGSDYGIWEPKWQIEGFVDWDYPSDEFSDFPRATTLGFVASCTVSCDGRVLVRLRLPTYFCAPDFAFLMVADAYDALTAVPGVQSAEVVLEYHFAAHAINTGVAARAGFVASFESEAVDELDQLRATFLRKAVMAGTGIEANTSICSGIFRARYPEHQP